MSKYRSEGALRASRPHAAEREAISGQAVVYAAREPTRTSLWREIMPNEDRTRTSVWHLVLAWTWVGIPLTIGVVLTIIKFAEALSTTRRRNLLSYGGGRAFF